MKRTVTYSSVRILFGMLIIGILISTSTETKAQQQLHLSQYSLYQPFLNPASIAMSKEMNGALVYRQQWVGYKGAPSVAGASFNVPFKKRKNFLGLTVFNDKIGVNNRTDISLSYAYRLALSQKSSLAFGLSATVAMLKSNLSDVETTDAGDPVFSSNTKTFAAPDFKFGINFFMERFYIGFALPRILDNQIIYYNLGGYQGNIGFDYKTLHYHLHSGYKFKLSDKWNLPVNFLMKFVYGAPVQFDVNMMVDYNNIFAIGASYRSQKIMVAMANVRITKYFRLGYAYDYNFTQLSQVSSGSHEIMLLFNLVKNTQPVKIDAPRF
ncbi:MAG: type IX secretion system membrane protein PorP/SprF [Flavobacteriales bacterium]|nr:type IX secretion system membrane protein PorP/SprF [Flavobacteriales bacterium]